MYAVINDDTGRVYGPFATLREAQEFVDWDDILTIGLWADLAPENVV